MTETQIAVDQKDECLRCGYDLRGIADGQPCPECGLLAERSRRVTDELHDTRPGWLRKIATGTALILIAVVMSAAWQLAWRDLWRYLANSFRLITASYQSYLFSYFEVPLLGHDMAVVILFSGTFLLSAREHYPPADRADAKLRRTVRCAAIMPALALLLAQVQIFIDMQYGSGYRRGWWNHWRATELIAAGLATIGCVPLPFLLFYRLRNLAKRARSAHLAEHCMIVGIGASLALVYVAAIWVLTANGDEWFGNYWTVRSNALLVLELLLGVAASLFLLWSVYLLIRFSIAFWIAGRKLRRKWREADRSREGAIA